MPISSQIVNWKSISNNYQHVLLMAQALPVKNYSIIIIIIVWGVDFYYRKFK